MEASGEADEMTVAEIDERRRQKRRATKLDCRSSFSGAPGHLAIVMGDKNHLFDVLGKAILIDLKPDCDAGWRGVALGKSPHSA